MAVREPPLKSNDWYEGRMEGRREVIEWIKDNDFEYSFSDNMMKNWEDQLKEWGINGSD